MTMKLVLRDASDEVVSTVTVDEEGHCVDENGSQLPAELVVYDDDGMEYAPDDGELWLKHAPQLFRSPYLVPTLEE